MFGSILPFQRFYLLLFTSFLSSSAVMLADFHSLSKPLFCKATLHLKGKTLSYFDSDQNSMDLFVNSILWCGGHTEQIKRFTFKPVAIPSLDFIDFDFFRGLVRRVNGVLCWD